jgi:hypothetical protein
MFEIELAQPNEISIKIAKNAINVNVAQSAVSAGLSVGEIRGPGEFEIGDAMITGIDSGDSFGGVAYRAVVGGVRIGIIPENFKGNLDDLGPIDILATAMSGSAAAIDPKIVIPIDGFEKIAAESKGELKTGKTLKVKGDSSLPVTLEVWRLD